MKKIFLYCLLSLITLPTSFSAFADSKYGKVKDFSFFDLEGKNHKFSDYKGTWVLVNYWATYCPPCRAEIPDIERFIANNKGKMVVLGMDAGGSDKTGILAFKKELDIHYPLIPMQESTLRAFGEVLGIPTSYIVSPSGEIVDKFVGIITYDDLDYYVNPPIFETALEVGKLITAQ